MSSATDLKLDEETVDDILYFARANEPTSFLDTLNSTSQTISASPVEVLRAATDERNGSTALHYAAANGHVDLLKQILVLLPESQSQPETNGNSSSPDVTNSEQQVTLSTSVVNSPNTSGNTPLHWAALNGHLEAVKLLVGAGASLELKNNAGKDAIFEAEGAGKEEVVSFLLGIGADKEANQAKEEGLEMNGTGVDKNVEEGMKNIKIEENEKD